MLLPSPLPCDARTQRPSSISIPTAARKMMSLSPDCQSPTAPTANIYTACCALQSLLTTSYPLSTTTPRPVARPLDSPIHLTAPARKAQKHKRYPSQGPLTAHKSLHTPAPPPAPSRKRRRDVTPTSCLTNDTEDKENTPATPKRKRICPPSLPLGLGQEDFDALQPTQPAQPHTPFQMQPNTQFVTPSRPIPFPQPAMRDHQRRADVEEDTPWTPNDDSALIGLILNKLQLRQSDWDECARKLGRGKASIGERFRVLVGEGPAEAPMRRGSGQLRRGSVQKMVFGPEIVRP